MTTKTVFNSSCVSSAPSAKLAQFFKTEHKKTGLVQEWTGRWNMPTASCTNVQIGGKRYKYLNK